jgi:hypothetical protein
MPSPLWGTFTGHCEGTWLGQYTAFTPWGGDPEPVWADASGAYLTHAFVRVSERRQLVPAEQLAEGGALGGAALGGGSGGGGGGPAAAGGTLGAGEELDLLVRSTLRSASISSLIGGTAAAAAAAGDGATAAASSSTSTSTSTGGTAAAADEEQEALAYNVGGCVVFNGGSYSLGPQDIELPLLDEDAAADFAAAAADAAAAASSGNPSSSADDDGEAAGGDGDDLLSLLPFSTVVVEQALVAGGDTRLRLVATLKLRQPPGQEMDIEVRGTTHQCVAWAVLCGGHDGRRGRGVWCEVLLSAPAVWCCSCACDVRRPTAAAVLCCRWRGCCCTRSIGTQMAQRAAQMPHAAATAAAAAAAAAAARSPPSCCSCCRLTGLTCPSHS